MKCQAGAILAAVLMLASVAPLRAATIVSNTVSDWMASTSGGVHDADFTHIQNISYGPSGYTSSDGFTITGPDGSGTFLQGLIFNGTQSLKGGSDSSGQIVVTTPAGGQTALLFLLGS